MPRETSLMELCHSASMLVKENRVGTPSLYLMCLEASSGGAKKVFRPCRTQNDRHEKKGHGLALTKIYPKGPELAFEGNKNPISSERWKCVTRFTCDKLKRRPIKKRQSAGRLEAGTRESCYAFRPLGRYEILIFFEGQLRAVWMDFQSKKRGRRVNLLAILLRKQRDPVVRALALRSEDPEFKTRFDHSLKLFQVVPGSTSQLHLQIVNWSASGQLVN